MEANDYTAIRYGGLQSLYSEVSVDLWCAMKQKFCLISDRF